VGNARCARFCPPYGDHEVVRRGQDLYRGRVGMA
jgi:hypothetical protein